MKSFIKLFKEQTDQKFKPPSHMKSAAQKALKYKDKYPNETSDSGTKTGWTRASQLASGDEISFDIVKRIYNFLNRHKSNAKINPKYKEEPWKDNGYLMYLAWGSQGDDRALNWAKSIIDKVEDEK